MASRPVLLMYCQHSLGLGHLVRSLALANALAEYFRVIFLNGGPFPRGVAAPKTIEVVSLPPLGMTTDGQLISRNRRYTVEKAQQRRRAILLEHFYTFKPQAIVIELFPFGRKKFATELLPFLEEARQQQPPPLILCSLRDILVGQRHDQQKHDERASVLANRYFDAILVHADPQFVRLEESFAPLTPLGIPVHYTGFVLPERKQALPVCEKRRRQVVVSAGGGIVGETLLRTAIEAHPLIWERERIHMTVIAGPFLPEAAWQSLRAAGGRRHGLTVRRSVANLCAEMRVSAASVSQCGYNTALDILQSGASALVVPFAAGNEDEQPRRAQRLEQLGAVRMLAPQHLEAATLAEKILSLLRFHPQQLNLNLDGARCTAALVHSLVGQSQPEISLTIRQETL